MSALSQRPLLATLLAISAMALSACAAGAYKSRPAAVGAPDVRLPAPNDKSTARRQLRYYLRQLASNRRALGLGSDAGPSVAAPPVAPQGHGGGKTTADVAPQPPSPARLSARRKAPVARAARPTAGVAAESHGDAGFSRQPRCPLPCRQARAICHAARRICKLADYLAEDDARQRCDQAREDCRQARQATQSRCSACPASPA
jgi:hypothetical protein